MISSPETIETIRAGGVATIWLNRPEARNAVNLRMAGELRDAVTECEADDEVRVIVIRARGSVFSAGADLKERNGVSETWLRNRRLAGFATYDAIEECEKPVIAVAQGPVVGSGCEIATACDFIIGTNAASFRYPEARWGTVGATQRLPRIVGRRMAKELLFTARILPAEEAFRVGLLNRLVEPDRLEAVLSEIVAQILECFPLAVRLAKRCVDVGMEGDLRSGKAYELLAIDRALADREWRAGVDQFAAAAKSGPAK